MAWDSQASQPRNDQVMECECLRGSAVASPGIQLGLLLENIDQHHLLRVARSVDDTVSDTHASFQCRRRTW